MVSVFALLFCPFLLLLSIVFINMRLTSSPILLDPPKRMYFEPWRICIVFYVCNTVILPVLLDRHPHGDLMILPRHKVDEIVEAIFQHLGQKFFSRFFFRDFYQLCQGLLITSLANKGLANKG